jgi:hypothetical protein
VGSVGLGELGIGAGAIAAGYLFYKLLASDFDHLYGPSQGNGGTQPGRENPNKGGSSSDEGSEPGGTGNANNPSGNPVGAPAPVPIGIPDTDPDTKLPPPLPPIHIALGHSLYLKRFAIQVNAHAFTSWSDLDLELGVTQAQINSGKIGHKGGLTLALEALALYPNIHFHMLRKLPKGLELTDENTSSGGEAAWLYPHTAYEYQWSKHLILLGKITYYEGTPPNATRSFYQ